MGTTSNGVDLLDTGECPSIQHAQSRERRLIRTCCLGRDHDGLHRDALGNEWKCGTCGDTRIDPAHEVMPTVCLDCCGVPKSAVETEIETRIAGMSVIVEHRAHIVLGLKQALAIVRGEDPDGVL